MKAVIQRVAEASVTIEKRETARISKGFLVLLGISTEDTEDEAVYLAGKVAGLRVFEDADEKMNLGISDVDGEILVVSNFTLCADCRKGKRPSFIGAARPEQAEPLYEKFVSLLRQAGVRRVETGTFGADMKVGLVNDGPITIVMDTTQMR